MNNFREWVSDYLRYILLGLILILLSALIFITIRRLDQRHTQRTAENPKYSVSDSAAEEAEGTVSPQDEEAAKKLLADYFNVLAMQNTDALRSLVDELSEPEETALKNRVPTQYHDLITVVKPGPSEDTLAAAVSYKYEELGAAGPVPDVRSFLLAKRSDGSLVIRNGALSTGEQAFMASFASDPDVTALVRKAQEEQNAAQQAAAAPSPTPIPTPVPTAAPAAQEEEKEEEDGNPFTVGEEYTVTTDCNLREEASYDGAIIDMLEEGQIVTVVGYDDGWVEIETDELSGYMGQDFLS